jgi:hypothetical protein
VQNVALILIPAHDQRLALSSLNLTLTSAANGTYNEGMTKGTAQDLLRDIEAFLKDHDMKATPFSVGATGSRHIVDRLRKGKQVRSETIDACRDYMRKYKSPKTPVKRRRQHAEAAV